MTKEEIIRMAREVFGKSAILPFSELERFAELVAAAKKEECAKEAEGITKFIRYQSKEHYKFASVIAAAIRAL